MENKEKNHLCFIISSLASSGGAEKVLAKLVNFFFQSKYKVSLITLDSKEKSFAYEIDPSVLIYRLDQLKESKSSVRRIKNIFSRLRSIRNKIKLIKPNLIISFMDIMNINVIISTRFLKTPILVCERIDPRHNIKSSLLRFLRNTTYKYADLILVQTQRGRDYFKGPLRQKTFVISNEIKTTNYCAKFNIMNEKLKIVSIGRLVEQKGFDILIKSFSLIHSKFPKWEILIYGEGPKRKDLEELRNNLGLNNKVHFLGLTKEPQKVLSEAHLMAFPSRYEGFPNALAEAASVGLPAIGFLGVSGVEDLIIHEKSGLLVRRNHEVDAFSKSLSRLMLDPDLRKKYGLVAKQHTLLWSGERIYPMWEKTIRSLLLK